MDPYEAWLEVNRWNSRRESVLRERLAGLSAPPRLSVLMPVYNPSLEFLDKAIRSVLGQVYENWELCIADDASAAPGVKPFLQNWAARERRVRVLFREANGQISAASNSAAGMAGGEFLVLLDQDDEITPDALGEVAIHLAENPSTDILYSDDDKIDADGLRYAPQFKPDWSPELLLSYMYLGHLFVVRRNLFEQAGGFRAGFEGAQDYDLALRATERARSVGHVPKVLYHWRALPSSTASSGNVKPGGFRAGRVAVQEALVRKGVSAEVYQPDWAAKAGCGIFSQRFPDHGPRVAIIIPTRNNVDLLKTCLASLARTTYRNYEVVIIDNESDDPKTLEYLRRLPHRVRRVPNPGRGFNFAAINNEAVRRTDADYVLFLNDDTEVLSPGWLSQMVGYLGVPGVGAVGARLLFPDGRVQHAGVVHGYDDGLAGPAFKLLPADEPGYLGHAKVARNYSAVTAACMLTPRDLFLRTGGFDEEHFAVAYNDVDYCYRLLAAGQRMVYCPTAELIHREGSSRGRRDHPAEPARLRKKYAGFRDPYYNPHLSLEHERFSIDAGTLAPENLKRVRALMCTHNLNWEGAPLAQFDIAVGLKEASVIEPVIYALRRGPLQRLYEERGIRVEVAPPTLAANLDPEDESQGIVESLAAWMQSLNVEIVHANTVVSYSAIAAAERLGLPSVWTIHESEPSTSLFSDFSPQATAQALSCFKYPYKVTFVSHATRAKWSALKTHHNFLTIHNGLDTKKFMAEVQRHGRDQARQRLHLAGETVMVLLVGTVCPRKGQLDLVEALSYLTEDVSARMCCFIVGDRRESAYSDRLHAAREALGKRQRAGLKIIAETPETALYYAAADIFVCASRQESFPRVVLEALAAGVAIITTPVDGIPEQVRDRNALFYQPGDIAKLSEHLTLLATNASLRQQMTVHHQHALDTLNTYDEMIAAYRELFRGAWLSATPRARPV
ncbi:MAG: glycosyltransferase [Pyrinomonadaceae bacterium]